MRAFVREPYGPRRFGAANDELTEIALRVGRLQALVFPTVMLVFNASSDLRYGNPDASDEQLWHYLEIAQARGFVEAMPQRLDAPIAQGGTNVSGGQRQRLAIARALVHQPQIYLFDDAFSALDLGTDARLRAALGRPHPQQYVINLLFSAGHSVPTSWPLRIPVNAGQGVPTRWRFPYWVA